MNLAGLSDNHKGIITRVTGHGAFRKRITEMGFVKGKEVTVIKNAPLQDPIEYEIMGYNVSLRRSEASMIEVVQDISGWQETTSYEGTFEGEQIEPVEGTKSRTIRVALVGNPNCGKTTLFNHASGLHERVGNYGGVTIDAKEAVIRSNGYKLLLTDLPGTYSITEYTPEELFVRNHLTASNPDIVVNVLDASNLERNLFLTTQLIDMNRKVIIALNMYDELAQKGIQLDFAGLGRLLGIPVVPTIAVKGRGIDALVEKIIEVYEGRDPVVRNVHINYGGFIEASIARVKAEIVKIQKSDARYSARYMAVKLLEGDQSTLGLLNGYVNFDDISRIAQSEMNLLEKEYGEKSETAIADAKYGFIAGALRETCSGYSATGLRRKPDMDYILTHKIWGFPVFFAFMWLMFQATFTVGSYPMEWIEGSISYLGNSISVLMPRGSLHDLIVDGIIGGVGGVIVFLPNILILFFFISVMEDTGDMARISFMMDKVVREIGLHGKGFIPLLMGFGCNVPAIMATRTLENQKDRIMTMLITPFMSCSARLPVYVLIISAFFPKYQGVVLFSVYFAGILIAVLIALLLKSTVFSKQDVPFVMELPPYRIPTIKNTIKHMWFKGSQYLRKMGTVILSASILIWALSYYPRNVKYSTGFDEQMALLRANTFLPEPDKNRQISALELKKASEHQEQSYLGRMGKLIEPALMPLGFDWKIGISLLTGLAAKEIVVGSMGVLYHAGLDADDNSGSLTGKLQEQKHASGKMKGEQVFTPWVAFGFMLFILIYFPCIAVIAAIRKESSWSVAIFTMLYTTAIAWIVAYLVHQAGNLLT
jgi:ferrous iron transport protein B